MRYLIMLEETEEGFAVQVPDLPVVTHGGDVETDKRSAAEAIRINLESYLEQDMPDPERRPLRDHLRNPEFDGLLFGFAEVSRSEETAAA
jgi:predicted RNase H-like HicB family nuclease